jgi:dihydropteroate synthase
VHEGGRRWIVDPRRGLVVARPAALMGILNATPDSFSDGGRHLDPGAAVAAGVRLVAEGAAWLDVGGESTRPGADPVAEDEEIRRVVPVIAGLRDAGVRAVISIDTAKAAVAAAALAAGADALNDVSAGGDPLMFPLAARHGCPLVLMHMQGTPRTMQREPRYDDVVAEVVAFLATRIAAAMAAGVAEDALLADPGIGFGKTVAHNLALLRALPAIEAALGRPLVVGVSRKAFIATLTGNPAPAAGRDADSHVLHALLAPRCALLRVHDVAGARRALALAAAAGGEDA